MPSESLMNCRECGNSDCGIYYTPIGDSWVAKFQCSFRETTATHGCGADKQEAYTHARVNWQSENAPTPPPSEG